MSDAGPIAAALRSVGRPGPVTDLEPLSGGCIHRVVGFRADGLALVAKMNDATRLGLFEEEARSLAELAAIGAVRVPEVVAVGAWEGRAVLLTERLAPAPADRADDRAWCAFGTALARQHAADVGTRYGFGFENHLGTTPQPNAWCDDWIEFVALHRLGWQIELARERGLLDDDERGTLDRVVERLGDLLPARPAPALLHGDLWSGNALATAAPGGDVEIAVIDPACSIGDGWADVAMMMLFGGFPGACLDAYRAAAGDAGDVGPRLGVYQLYHLLNHLNLFGRGYAAQVHGLARRLVRDGA